VVFPGFDPLDIFGPLELFSGVSYTHNMTLSLIASQVGPVSSRVPPHVMVPGMPPLEAGHMLQQSIVATHSFQSAPKLDILLIPGGMGNVALEEHGDTSIEDFVAQRFSEVDYLLSVCTGSFSLAKAGVLDGRRATTNKASWGWVTTRDYGVNITWVPTARWVEDGKVWSSSGVSSGLDMTYAFLRHLYGSDDEGLTTLMSTIEYAPHTNPHWDPFAVVNKVPGANETAGLIDCVTAVGL
ncbi:class I glutamine amidotransferase-like protein, partial [Lasiosphaeris hirsuta]